MKRSTLHIILWLLLLLIGLPLLGQGQSFSPDGSLLLVPAKDNEGTPILALITPTGKDFTPLAQSKGAVTGVWSPDGKSILFVDSAHSLFLYNVKEKATNGITSNVEGPLTWREDGMAFAAISVTQDKDENTIRELSRYDKDGHIMGHIPLGDLKIDVRYPLYWISQTDEVAVFARHQEGTNCYITDADQIRRVSTSHDLHGLGAIGGGKSLLWARRGENLHYILMTLYRYVPRLNTIERLTFPQRLPLLNPNTRTAPEVLKDVVFSSDGTRILITAVVKVADKTTLNLYSLRSDGSGMKLLHKFATPPANVPAFPAQISGDGKQVAWFDNATLFVCNTDGTGKTKIAIPDLTQKDGQ